MERILQQITGFNTLIFSLESVTNIILIEVIASEEENSKFYLILILNLKHLMVFQTQQGSTATPFSAPYKWNGQTELVFVNHWQPEKYLLGRLLPWIKIHHRFHHYVYSVGLFFINISLHSVITKLNEHTVHTHLIWSTLMYCVIMPHHHQFYVVASHHNYHHEMSNSLRHLKRAI